MPDVFGGSFVGASLGSVRGIISLDAAPALAALAAVGEGARKLGNDTAASAGQASDGLRTIGAGMAVAGAGILGFAAAVGVSAVQAASKFQASMELIHTQAGATQQEVTTMSSAVLGLAGKVATAPEELSVALFHLESAGFRGKTAIEALTVAAEGAKVGQANLEDVTNTLDAVLVAGGKDAQNMSASMGELNAIVGAGDMHMQDLAQAMGTGIIATAHSFGLSLQDVGAALAVLGDNNIRGADAATKLRSSIVLIGAPSGVAAKALAEIGLSSTQLADDMRSPGGLVTALSDLKQHLTDSGKSATEQAQIVAAAFGRGKSSSTVLLLLEQLDRLKQKYGEIGGAANRFGADWQATTETAAFQSAKLHATLDALKVAIGIGLLPAFNAFLEAVTPIALALARWAAAHEKLSGIILIAVGALGALLAVVGVGILIFPTLAAAVTILLSPIALAAAAVVALGAALAVAYGTNFLGFGDAVRGVADAVGRAALTFVDLVRSGINPLSAAIFALGPLFPKFLQGPLFAAADAIDHLGAGIGEFLTVAKRFYDLQGIGGVLDYLGIRLFNAFGQPALDIFLAFRDAVGAVVTDMRAVLADLGNLFHDVVHGNIDQALHDMVSLFKDAMLGLADAALIVPRLVLSAFVAVDWSAVGATLSKGLSGALALLGRAGAALGGLALSLGGSLLAAIGNIDWGGIGGAIVAGLDAAVHAVKLGVIELGSIGSHVAGWLVAGAEDLWDKVVAFATRIWGSNTSDPNGGPGIDGTGGAAIPGRTLNLFSVGAHVAGWIADGARDLWAKVATFGKGLIPKGKDAVVDLGQITASVAGWAVGGAADLGARLVARVHGLLGLGGSAGPGFESHTGVSFGGIDLGDWVLHVGVPTLIGWVEGAATWIQGKLESLVHTGRDWYVDLKAWAVSIKKPVLDVLEDVGKAIQDTLESLVHTGKDWYVDLKTWLVSIKKPVFDVLDDVGKDLQDKLESLIHTGKDWLVDLKDWAVSIPEPHPILWAQDAIGWLKGKLGALFGGGEAGPGFEANTGRTIGAGPLASVEGWVLNIGIPTVVGWIEGAVAWIAAKVQAAFHLAGSGLASVDHWVLNIGIPTVVGWIETAGAWIVGKVTTAVNETGRGLASVEGWVLDIGEPHPILWTQDAIGWLKGKLGALFGSGEAGPGFEAHTGVSFGGGPLASVEGWALNVGVPTPAGWIDGAITWVVRRLKDALHVAGVPLASVEGWVLSIGEPHPVLWTEDVVGWVRGKVHALFGGGEAGPGFEAHTGVTFGAGPLASVTGWTLDIGIPKAVGWVKTAATWVHDTIAGALKDVNLFDVGQGVGDKVSKALDGIKWGTIGQDFGYAAGTALAAGLKLVGALVTVAVGALASGDLVKAVVNLGASLVTGFVTGFDKALADQFPGLGPAITKALKPVTDAFDALPKSVQDTIKRFGDALGGWAGPAAKFGVVAAALTLVLDAFVPAVGALAIAAGVLDPELIVMALAFAGLYLLVSHVHDLAQAVQDLADATKKMTGLSLGTILKDLVTSGTGLGAVADNAGKLADTLKKLNDALQGNTAADHFKQLGGALAVVALAMFFVAPEFVAIALVAAGLAFAASQVAKHWDDVKRVFHDIVQPAKDGYDALHNLTGLDFSSFISSLDPAFAAVNNMAAALRALAAAYQLAKQAFAFLGIAGAGPTGDTNARPGANASGSGPKLPPDTQPIPVPPGAVVLPGAIPTFAATSAITAMRDVLNQATTAVGNLGAAAVPAAAKAQAMAAALQHAATSGGSLAAALGPAVPPGLVPSLNATATAAQAADAAFAHLVTQGHAYAALVTAGANITAAGGVPGVGGGPSLGGLTTPSFAGANLPLAAGRQGAAAGAAFATRFEDALRPIHTTPLPLPTAASTDDYVSKYGDTINALIKLQKKALTAAGELNRVMSAEGTVRAVLAPPWWAEAVKALADPRGLGSAGSNLVGGGTPGLGTIPAQRGADEAFPRVPVTAKLAIDTAPFETGLARAGGLGVAFAAKPILPKADADTAPFVAGIARLAALGAGFAAHAFRAKGDVDTTGAGRGIGAALAAGTAFATHVFKAKTDADPATALKGIGDVLAAGTAFAGKTFSATVAVHAVEAKDSFAKSPATPGVGDALAGVQATGLAAQGEAAAKSFLDAFAKGLTGVGPALGAALADVGARAAAMAAIAGQVGTAGGVGLVAALAKALAAVGATMAALLAGIGAEAGAMVAIAGQVGTAGGTSLNAGLSTALGGVNATMASLLAGVGGYAGPFAAIGGQVGSAGGASFALGFGNAGRAAIGYAADIGNGVFAALNLNLYDLGANAGGTFASGLASQAQAAANAAYAVASAAQSAMQTTLGVFSPSRVFRKIADFVVAGFVQGLQAGVDPVRRATEALVALPTPSAGAASSPLASQPTRGAAATQINVVNVQALKSTELIELMKQAENGDTAFAYTQLLNNGWAAMVALGASGGQS